MHRPPCAGCPCAPLGLSCPAIQRGHPRFCELHRTDPVTWDPALIQLAQADRARHGDSPPGVIDVPPPALVISPWQPGDGFTPLATIPARPESGRGAVTVLIPTAWRPHTIGTAIRSVLAQTRADWRLIVCLNGAYPVAAYAAALDPFRADARISTVASAEPGIPQALNVGLGATDSEYVAILDDDDTWEPEFLERLTAALDADDSLGMAWCDLREVRDGAEIDWTVTPEGVAADPAAFAFELWAQNWITCPMGLFRRAFVPGGFDPRAGGCTDWDVWLRCTVPTGGRTAHVPHQLITHFWTHDNTSGGANPRQAAWHHYLKAKQFAGAYGPPPPERIRAPRHRGRRPLNNPPPRPAVRDQLDRFRRAQTCPHRSTKGCGCGGKAHCALGYGLRGLVYLSDCASCEHLPETAP